MHMQMQRRILLAPVLSLACLLLTTARDADAVTFARKKRGGNMSTCAENRQPTTQDGSSSSYSSALGATSTVSSASTPSPSSHTIAANFLEASARRAATAVAT